MVILELTLDELKFANVYEFERNYGTKKNSATNGGSLTTKEFNIANALPFDLMRPTVINESSSIVNIEYDAKLNITAPSKITLTIENGEYTGQLVSIYNTSAVEHTVNVNGEDFPIAAGKEVVLYWAGVWRAECRVPIDDVYVQYGGMKFPQELFPCTKWTNISENYKGEFFRVAGGNSASTITEYSSGSVYSYKHQDMMIQEHAHVTSPITPFKMHTNVAETTGGSWSNVGSPISNNTGKTGGIETRPVNSAIQMWQRIS